MVAPSVLAAGLPKGATDRALLLALSGPAVGQAYPIGPQPAVIGRGRGNDATITDPEISRQHARVVLTDGRFIISDLGSINGTFVNGTRIAAPTPLHDGDRVQFGALTVVKFSQLDLLEAMVQRRLHDAIHMDVLTGVHNRRYLETRLLDEFAYAKRHKRSLCVLMLDIDHFKRVNDTHGHLIGDLVLRELGAQLAREVRAEDVVVRYGGEEFLIVARELTLKQGREFGERVRACVHVKPVVLPDGTQLSITISVGVANLRLRLDKEPAAIIARADAALYRAKQLGRNRVETGTKRPGTKSRARLRR